MDSRDLIALLRFEPATAVAQLRTLADRGEPQAQLLLGQLLVNGVGDLRDDTAALRWFRAAASALVPMAMNMIGRCYEYGRGISQDFERAAHWYHRAAIHGCDWAIYNYAHMLAHGRGAPRDRAASFVWFRLAASRGHTRAMNFLGEYYEHGWETPVNRKVAYDWYRRSAEGGDYRGQCSHASVLARRGEIDLALHWLRLAVTTATPRYLRSLVTTLQQSGHPALSEFAKTIAIPHTDAPRRASELHGSRQ